MSKFEPGDRVRVYFMAAPPTKARVLEVEPGGLLRVEDDGDRRAYFVWPKACRKLVKKERRRIWILDENLEEFVQGQMRGYDVLHRCDCWVGRGHPKEVSNKDGVTRSLPMINSVVAIQ